MKRVFLTGLSRTPRLRWVPLLTGGTLALMVTLAGCAGGSGRAYPLAPGLAGGSPGGGWTGASERNLFGKNKIDYPVSFTVSRRAPVARARANSPAWTSLQPNLFFGPTRLSAVPPVAKNYTRRAWPRAEKPSGYTTYRENISYYEDMWLEQIDTGYGPPRQRLYQRLRGYRVVSQGR